MNYRAVPCVLVLTMVLTAGAACSASDTPQEASEQPAARGNTSPLDGRWRVGSPLSFGNLTVFPVTSQQLLATPSFITLEEGLRSGRIAVMERGANGRLRRFRSGRDTDDEAEVNELTLINRSGKTLVLIAGEMFAGGKQDRIVAHDCLVASTGRPVPIKVFCVERGRWEEQPTFGQNRSVADQRPAGRGSAAGFADGASLGLTMSISPGIASNNVREKAQTTKDQTDVWAEVDKTNSQNSVSPATRTLTAVFEDRNVTRKLEEYERALRAASRDPRGVGAIVAIGGRIRSADVFANNLLFAKYWPKLLRSCALEAMNATSSSSGALVGRETASAFLARVTGERAAAGKSQVYRLVEHQSDTEASFELVGTASKASRLIHFNRFAKEE